MILHFSLFLTLCNALGLLFICKLETWSLRYKARSMRLSYPVGAQFSSKNLIENGTAYYNVPFLFLKFY